jgi:hypothetical protein
MSQGMASGRLSQGEQRALAAFLAGRLPAGQLHAELCRGREGETAAVPLTPAVPAPSPPPVVVALSAA